MSPLFTFELVVENRGPGISLLRRDEVWAVPNRVVIVDRGDHPEVRMLVVRPDLADDLRLRRPFGRGLGESIADVVPILKGGRRNGLDLVGRGDSG